MSALLFDMFLNFSGDAVLYVFYPSRCTQAPSGNVELGHFYVAAESEQSWSFDIVQTIRKYEV